MRHYEFIFEYSRDKTIQNWGQKMWQRISKDPDMPQKTRDVTDPDEQMRAVAYYLDRLERADPTKNKQYVQNLIKFYIAGERLEDLQSTAVDYLTKFHTLKNKKQIKPPRSDLNRYADFGDFANVMDEYPDPTDKAEKDRGDANEVYRDANVRIITPNDQAAACYYGQGTRWCTAADNNNMFNQYNEEGPMYILIPTKAQSDGEKYQIHPESGQYMDEDDSEVDARTLIDRFGPDFKAWLLKTDTSLLKQVEYYPDEQKLMGAWNDISDIVQDKVFEQMAEWEMDDDYYHEYLQDNGMLDADGEIKDDATPYDEYNQDAGHWQSQMLSVRDYTIDDVRETVERMEYNDYRDAVYLHDLDDVYGFATNLAISKTQYAVQRMDDWIVKNVQVTVDDDDEFQVEKVNKAE